MSGRVISPIRLIAVDLDGTLLMSRVEPASGGAGELTSAMPLVRQIVPAPEGARLLKAAARNGVHVVLATARAIYSVRDLCRCLEISSPVICTDGAQVYDSIDGTVVQSFTFPREVGLEIASLADARGWELKTTVGATSYYRQRPGQALGQFAPGRAIAATNADAVTDNPIRMVFASNPEAVKQLLAFCQSKFSERCCIQPHHGPGGETTDLSIYGLGASKGNALGLVMERLGVSQSEVMAIGDDHNDLPMFSRARIKIAMGNAQPELKEQATAIAPSNDEEGVAWALRKFVL
ncbi:MAG: HAD-IIB family hydrolase [Chloroflexi bacterium]|nr:HAD-IIB family hydrolase [Chloroflexota bacterium]